ncbi:helix-turn-helix domain-containing protein [Clostridium sp.]|uniref:helix-turn-helix domain-containing protein n=1 Tax=Clostridium sp. TaxID=1506 RepID=UPI0026358D91|nr:helix-turn-helix domain-containing protein [Clostridium sp.]
MQKLQKKWGLSDSTLRKMATTNKLIEGVDYSKSGKVWLITKDAMRRVYGEPKNK